MESRAIATTTTNRTTAAFPVVAYEFPCSYLGNPNPIRSAIGSAILGELVAPTLQRNSDENNNDDLVTTIPSTNLPIVSEAKRDEPSQWLSCPRNTIDGIRSSTILETEKSVAALQQFHEANTTSVGITTQELAVEVWFTPQQPGPTSTTSDDAELPLLPILAIARPLDQKALESSNDERRDPCESAQLAIGLRGSFLELRYRDHYEYLPDSLFEYDDDYDDFIHQDENTSPPLQYSCRVLRLTQWKLGEADDELHRKGAEVGPHHLMVVWKHSGSVLQIFGNGKSVATINLLPPESAIEGIPNDADFLRHWDPSFRLQVFSDSSRWFETMTGSSTDATKRRLTSSRDTFNNTTRNDNVLFPGSIHEVALYRDGLDEDTVKTFYEDGIAKRNDPFKFFFEDHPFEPLRLVSSPASSTNEDNAGWMKGVSVAQGIPALLSVGASEASNTTTALWDVLVEIVDLPRYGNLVYYFNNSSNDLWEREYYVHAQVGDRFWLPEGSLRTSLEYQHTMEEYFSVPKRSYHGNLLPTADLPGESFSYRLIATKKTDGKNMPSDFASETVILGMSEPVVQELTIVHKNHPPFFVGLPQQVWQPEQQPSGVGARPWAMLGPHVVLNDTRDHDIDRVRLDLWAHNGTLTIDLEDTALQEMAEIFGCSNPMPSFDGGEWICNGRNDRNMSLLATPTDVSKILSNLQYHAWHWDTTDSIDLTVYDGSGGSSCPEHLKINITIRETCFRIAASVTVPSLSEAVGGGPGGNLWRDHRSWWMGLVLFLAILSATCCCAITCFKRCRRIKKLNDIAVADDANSRNAVVMAAPEEGDFPSSLGITEEDQRATSGLGRTESKGENSV